MATFREEYSESFSSAIIAATASESFGATEVENIHRVRYGSANSLLITNIASETFRVDLDGLSSKTVGFLYPNGSFSITPEEGIYFNHLKLTNVSGTNSSADEVKIRIARAKRVGS